MFDLIKGRERALLASRDAVIYLFNTFRFVGFNPPAQCRFVYFFYSSIITLFIVLLSPLIFNVGWIRDRNILTIMEILNCVQAALNVIGVPVKSITLALSLDRLRSIEPLLMRLDARYTAPEDMAKIRSSAITGNRIVFGFIVSYMMYAALTLMSALLGGHAPLTLWIPYVDWHRSMWEYWLQVSFDTLMLFYILFHQIVNDSYPAVYIYIIRTQVQLLASRVRRLGTMAHKGKDATYHELQECIITHQEILRLVSIVEPVISVTMFVQFFIAAAILGTTMINIFIFADATSRIASVTYLFCVVLQTSPACYYATHLQSDCEQLTLSIFHYNWMTQGKRFNKLLIYFLQRSQDEMPLFAMKLVPINLATSVSIGKFSFTLYTFIQKMGVGKNLKN
ncbi:PREDICTED: odorant receptor 7a-like [Rhagoletis zephyria]|uniref:odorant receptor 7a-like n=1 Tax=Rhagoletis zephyria TaxID=28612 RepID=UPI00081162AD|nr:PREDICTED: odorant receptor 7a-like [Rhagoletis zephyria]XP_017486569.1 PREDICTED: odorant receptor 7a-like [Rhagoletis zephyria]